MIIYFETVNGVTWAVVVDEHGDVVGRHRARRQKAA
jgi:hypothetical protein